MRGVHALYDKGQGSAPSVFVTGATINGGPANPVALGQNVKTGDLAVCLNTFSTDTAFAHRLNLPDGSIQNVPLLHYAAWSEYSYSFADVGAAVVTKDVSAGYGFITPRSTTYTNAVAIYRGGSRAIVRNFLNTPAGSYQAYNATKVIPGFAKSSGCRRILVAVYDRDADTSAATGLTGAPSSKRLAADYGAFSLVLFDIDPANYVNGTALTLTGLAGASGYDQVAYLLEILD